MFFERGQAVKGIELGWTRSNPHARILTTVAFRPEIHHASVWGDAIPHPPDPGRGQGYNTQGKNRPEPSGRHTRNLRRFPATDNPQYAMSGGIP